ncbi:MAG: hypothetical protein FJ299_11040 [Planctomycetes bacterium]|nr:hypothetical protein [Planctomycetota bacterium]
MSAASEAAAPAASGRGDQAIAAAIALALVLLYAATQQSTYYADARGLLNIVMSGQWAMHNLAYVPCVHVLRALLAPLVGADPEPAMRVISVASGALGTALLYLAARRIALSRSAALAGTALAGLSPLVWFYATVAEKYALYYFVCALGLWFLAGLERRRVLGANALPLAFLLVALWFTHMTGCLWGPALALIALRGPGGWRLPRWWWLAPFVGLGGVALWWTLVPSAAFGGSYVGMGVQGLQSAWNFESLWREFLLPVAMLAPAGIAAWLHGTWQRLSDRAASSAPSLVPGAAALAVLTFVALIVGLPLATRGAYYLGALPWLALLACRAGALCGRVGLALCALLVVAQAWLGWRWVHELDHGYRGEEWIPTLAEELGNRGLVLGLEHWEWVEIMGHSRIDAVSLRSNQVTLDPGLPSTLDFARGLIDVHRARGHAIVLTRSLVEEPSARPLLDGLVARHGPWRAGRRHEYVVLVPGDAR